jgi:hypothetical protein
VRRPRAADSHVAANEDRQVRDFPADRTGAGFQAALADLSDLVPPDVL